MRKGILALALGIVVLAAPAAAQVYDHSTHLPGMNHSMLASSNPSEGAVLDQAPQALTLNYLAEEARVEAIAREEAGRCAFDVKRISVNAADRPEDSAIYLAVTGTSLQ